jgi:hypothetical protein
MCRGHTTEITRLVTNDEQVVVGGDFNELLGHNPGLMASVCAKNSLFDVHALFHGGAADIPTYARGSTKLDYCIASTSLEPYIAASRLISSTSAFTRTIVPSLLIFV